MPRWAKILPHILLTLISVSCCLWLVLRDQRHRHEKNELERLLNQERSRQAVDLDRDLGFRHLFDVNGVHARLRIPEGENHCGLTLVEYENGRRKVLTRTIKTIHGDRILETSLTWGKAPDGEKLIFLHGAAYMTIPGSFATKYRGGSSIVSYEKETLGSLPLLNGEIVLNEIFSTELRVGVTDQSSHYGFPQKQIDNRKHVMFLLLRPFPSNAAALAWADTPSE
jgi:hypothetical protein